MQEHEREAAFVGRMVDTLIKRHKDKVIDLTDAIDEEAILRESGIKGINQDMDVLQELADEIANAIAAHTAAAEAFADTYNEQNKKLMAVAAENQEKTIIETCNNFEFRIREAIGLVELVGGAAAFEVLEGCRKEIEDMGKSSA